MSPAEELALQIEAERLQELKPALCYNRIWECRLRERRKALKLTLRQVAERIGFSIGHVSAIEHGAETTLRTARLLADFFGVTIEDLWPKLKEEVQGQ